MSFQLVSTSSLLQPASSLRRTLNLSWRHMPVRLGITCKELNEIRFGGSLDQATMQVVSRRIAALSRAA